VRQGEVIGGFRVGRLIGRGSRGAVYEALQLSLERPVALRLLEPGDFDGAEDESRFLSQSRIAAALHHPAIVPTYEAGVWEGGRFLASRYIRGRTLAVAMAAGDVPAERADPITDALADALAAAHGAGLVHGRVNADNVLIDRAGNALLPDLGLGRAGTAQGDLAALEELRAELASGATAPRHRARRLFVPAVAALAVIAAGAAIVASGSADQDVSAEAPPPVAAGAEPSGSDLAPGSASSVGCASEPSPNTPVCTFAQTSAPVRVDGAIRSWAVRNASGDLSLQVVGERGGRIFIRSFSQFESVPDLAPHAFATDVRVERGDVVGVTLAPGAAIGTRPAADGAVASRWSGTLPLSPERTRAAELDAELLLRVDVEAGGRPDLTQLSGRAAEAAPSGAALAAQVVRAPGGLIFRVELTRAGDELTVDSNREGRRFARAVVEGAELDGQLLSFISDCGFRHGLCLRWQNDGDPGPVVHAYRLTERGTFRQIG